MRKCVFPVHFFIYIQGTETAIGNAQGTPTSKRAFDACVCCVSRCVCLCACMYVCMCV